MNEVKDILPRLEQCLSLAPNIVEKAGNAIHPGFDSLAQFLVSEGVNARNLAEAMAEHFTLPFLELEEDAVDLELVQNIAAATLYDALTLPIRQSGASGPTFLTADPTLRPALEQLESGFDSPLQYAVCDYPSMLEALCQLFGPKLVLEKAELEKEFYPLLADDIRIGKAAENDIVLDDPTVSRRHARILREGETLRIHDMDSANGTRINGRRMETDDFLSPGDVIHFGQVKFSYIDLRKPEAPATALMVSKKAKKGAGKKKGSTQLRSAEKQKPEEDGNQGPTEELTSVADKEEPKEITPSSTKKERKGEKKKKKSETPSESNLEKAVPKKDKAEKDKAEKDKAEKAKSDSRMKAAWLRSIAQLVATGMAALTPFVAVYLLRDSPNKGKVAPMASESLSIRHFSFPGRYEPSGIVQAPSSDRLLFVDDSKHGLLLGFQLGPGGEVEEKALSSQGLPLKPPPEDLEGMTSDLSGRIYAISSHSLDHKGHERPSALAQLEADGATGNVKLVGQIRDLRKKLLETYPVLKPYAALPPAAGGLNIEGLAYDIFNHRLLMGLRSPLIDNKAQLVVARIKNPAAPLSLEQLEFEPRLLELELKGGGIRGMEFDPNYGSFFIISGGPVGAGSFHLWQWGGKEEPPRMLDRVVFKDGWKPEGIARVTLSKYGDTSFLVVVDDSDGYMILPEPLE